MGVPADVAAYSGLGTPDRDGLADRALGTSFYCNQPPKQKETTWNTDN